MSSTRTVAALTMIAGVLASSGFRSSRIVCELPSDDSGTSPIATGSVIFIHPDGAGLNAWAAARMLHVGPDADLNWDMLSSVAVYRGHMTDALTATSNGGGTIHAYGVKVEHGAFGNDDKKAIPGASGYSGSIMQEAKARGKSVGIINSAAFVDAGTGVFLASVDSRRRYHEIAAKVLDSGADVIMGGGEQFCLPKGVMGRHGPGTREDGRNLVTEARAKGYHVVFTRDELATIPTGTTKLLGLFAAVDTFNDKSEEELRAKNLPMYVATAPDVGEMTAAVLPILARNPEGFLLVTEEEGSDNFGGVNNAAGMFEALRRADKAIGVAHEFLNLNPRTLVLTCCDSDCGGLQVFSNHDLKPDASLPLTDENGAPMDGRDGTGTLPFIAKPDRAGSTMPFGVVWAAADDISGAIVVRAEGLNADLVRGSFDNTRVYRVIYATLFGKKIP